MKVQREDGTHTANAKQVHAFVEQAWMPIFKMHERGTRPTWPQFEAEFGEHVPSACDCVINEMNGEKLKNPCKRMENTSAPGADGWRVAELQALPLQLFEKLAEVLNLVEETGTKTDTAQTLWRRFCTSKIEADRPDGICVQALGFAENT